MKETNSRKKPPCDKCPYKLGQVRTTVDPCPQCKAGGYKTYEMFTKHAAEGEGKTGGW